MFVVMPQEDAPPATLASGGAAMAADYTWPVVLLGMTAIVIFVPGARKGMRAFTFSLMHTNLWFVGVKRGRVRVRVHSFISTAASSCFVNASRKFSDSEDLVKEEEEGNGRELHPSRKDCGTGCILGTEMASHNTSGNTSPVFTADRMNLVSLSRGNFRSGLHLGSVCADVADRGIVARVPGELKIWDSGVKRSEENVEQNFLLADNVLPNWGSSLLEPLQIVRAEVVPFGLFKRKASDVLADYHWDAVMTLRLGAHNQKTIQPGTQEIFYASAVVRGATHTATLLKDVVRVWENQSRRAVMEVPVKDEYSICSLDVDWEREIALLGSSSGMLSLWDLEKATRVSQVDSQLGSIYAVHCIAAAGAEKDRWMVATRAPSNEDPRGQVSFWDSRMLRGPAVGTVCLNSSRLADVKYQGFQFVARDCYNTISKHDVRMLGSPLSSVVAEDVRTSHLSTRTPKVSLEEEWWLVGASDLFQEEDDCGECFWEQEEKVPSCSPGVLSRCFSALSSALSR